MKNKAVAINPKFSEGVELFEASFESFEFGKHWHEELAIGMILKGAQRCFYRGSECLNPERHLAIINPGEVHTGKPFSEEGYAYKMLYIQPTALFKVAQECDLNLSTFPAIEEFLIDDLQLFYKFLGVYDALKAGHDSLMWQSLLKEALSELIRKYTCIAGYEEEVVSFHFKAAMIRDYLEEYWFRDISLEELCRVTDLSAYYLIRLFKKHYGMPPHQFLMQLRAKHSKPLLQQGARISDIANDCGFFDQSHFTHFFKRTFGISPKQYQHSFIQ